MFVGDNDPKYLEGTGHLLLCTQSPKMCTHKEAMTAVVSSKILLSPEASDCEF